MNKKVYYDEHDVDEPQESPSDVPFSVLMQQACTIKSKQNEIFRRRYDSWPVWYQHTMFSKEDIIKARESSFRGRSKF
jgi:hypothetical protein